MWGKAFAAALAILLVGLGFHGYQLYSAARGIELTRVSIASFELKGRPIPTYIFLQLDLYLRNPTSTYIELERLSYKIYINDRFAAEGEKEHIFIPASSETPVRLPVEIATSDILNLVISLLREGGRNLDVEVKGLMHIPIKLFGAVRAFTVSMPFQATQTYTIPSTLAPPATPTPPTTPPGPYTPPAASGHTDLHYDQSIKTAEVDRPNVKLKLYLIVKGPV
ncbi:MAG: LEA type 2 family protein, partial [Candidatus Bathyarchaeia archaeon]